mgnify:CR=1 FL=1
MNHIEKMFAHKGKSSKLIGDTKSKVYKEIYNYLSELQKSAKIKRDELNKPIMAKSTKTDKTKKDLMPPYVVKKGKEHIHYE